MANTTSIFNIHQILATYSIDPNSRGDVTFGGEQDSYVWFGDNAGGAGNSRRVCVLIDPALPAATIATLTPVLTQKRAPSAFKLIDALPFRQVFAVGYTRAQLDQQAQNDIGVSLNTAEKDADCKIKIVPTGNAAQRLTALLP